MYFIIFTLISIGVLLAPLGCAMLWQRYGYFSDGLAHASVLSGAISLSLGIPLYITAPIIALVFAALVQLIKSKNDNNLSINIISSSMLALSLMIMSLFPGEYVREDIFFGDILSATYKDLIFASILCVISYSIFYFFLNPIIIISLNKDLALSKGIKVRRYEISLMIYYSIVLAFVMKIVGALVSVGMVILPPAIAKFYSKSPVQMILLSGVIGMVSASSGCALALYFDFPVGPSIVILNALIYFLSFIKNN